MYCLSLFPTTLPSNKTEHLSVAPLSLSFPLPLTWFSSERKEEAKRRKREEEDSLVFPAGVLEADGSDRGGKE